MKTQNLLHEIAIRTGVKKTVWLLLMLSVATNFCLSAVLMIKGTVVQNILTPPEIRRSMTVSNIGFSKEYLEEMAPYVAYLLLNATPQTVDYQNGQLLKLVDPEYRNVLERELNVNALWLKRNNVSTSFSSLSAAADTDDNSVILKGRFDVRKNNLPVESKERGLQVIFKNNNGTLSLLSIKEIQSKTVKKDGQDIDQAPAVETEEVTVSNTVSDFKGGR